MPYLTNDGLPAHAQDIYRAAFNHVWEQYKSTKNRRDSSESQEQVAHKVAWAAVEKNIERIQMEIGELYD